MKFYGIGNKVADCIALFSMNCNDITPIDTHVWQIYNKIYAKQAGNCSDQKKKKKSNLTSNSKEKVSKGTYDTITQFFKEKFGEYAGWAHSYLFIVDLNYDILKKGTL